MKTPYDFYEGFFRSKQATILVSVDMDIPSVVGFRGGVGFSNGPQGVEIGFAFSGTAPN